MTPIYVTKFEKDIQDQAMEFCFIDAFPYQINSTPISYGPADVLKMTVQFYYTRYVKRNLVGKSSQSRTRDTSDRFGDFFINRDLGVGANDNSGSLSGFA